MKQSRRYAKMALGVAFVLLLLGVVACRPAPAVTPSTPTPMAPPAPAATPTPTLPPLATPTPVPTPVLATPTPVPTPTPVAAPLTWLERYMKAPGYKPEWGQPRKGGIFRYGGSHVLLGHDPAYGHSFNGPQFLPTYNRLVRFVPWQGNTGAVEGDLAETWEISPDGLKVTFKLRKGVKFQNNPNLPAKIRDLVSGDEFTCEDAEATMKWLLFPPKEIALLHTGPRSALLAGYKGSSCPDGPKGYTFVVELKEPRANIITAFAGGRGVYFMDKDFIDWLYAECPDCLDKTDPKNFLLGTGTGPFVPVEYQHQVVSKTRRNPTYFREGLPLLDGMDMFVITDFTTRFTALVTGQVHYFGEGSASLLPGQVEEITKRFSDRFVVQPTLHTWGKGIVLNLKRKPLDDKRVTKALFLSLDFDEWVTFNTIAGKIVGVYHPTNWMPPQTIWALPDQELMSYPGWRRPKAPDIAEANRLLDEAGYRKGPDGIRFKISCMAQSSQMYIDGCLFVKDQWKKNLGIEVVMDVVESAVERERYLSENYDMHYGSKQVTDWGDPDNFYMQMLVRETASKYYQNTGSFDRDPQLAEELERMALQQSRELDPAKRREIVHTIERKLATEAYWNIPFPWSMIFPAWSKDVRGWNMGPFPSQTKDSQWELVWLAR